MIKVMLILWLMSIILGAIAIVLVKGMDYIDTLACAITGRYPTRVLISCALAGLTWIATIVVTIITIITW